MKALLSGMMLAVTLGLMPLACGDFSAQRVPQVLSVDIEQADRGLRVGETADFSAALQVTGGAGRDVSWHVSDSRLASVDRAGQLRALAAGA